MNPPDYSIEYSFVKLPYDCGVRNFKITKKMVEKEMSSILNGILTLRKDKELTRAYSVKALKDYVNRLQSLEKTLDDRYNEEDQIYQTTKKRLVHLRDVATGNDKESENVYYETRVKRLISDHLLRENCYVTAQNIIKEYNMEELTAFDDKMILEYNQILKDLQHNSCKSAFAWCQANKSKLMKTNSNFQIKLVVQEFIEKVKKGETNEALAYIRKNSSFFDEAHMNELKQAMGCLTFYKTIDKFPKYKYLLSDARWKELIEMFKKESFLLYGISDQSQLEITLKAGISSLKTYQCVHQERSPSSVPQSCPICHKHMQKMANNVPSTHKVVSSLICRLTGKIMDEHNPPVALPNGQVYSLKGLKHFAKKYGGKFYCPTTKESFDPSEATRIFIS